MEFKRLRRTFSRFRCIPLHPQWLIYYKEKHNLAEICGNMNGLVLDIGCADQRPRNFLPAECRYIGLDYYETATHWYGTRPHVYGDAHSMPISTNSVDNVLLLDVLEHLPKPETCIREIERVLKPGGRLTIQVPFMYPIHDAPLDFHRWTIHGLRELADRTHFVVKEEIAFGSPVESAALLANIAISKTVLNWLRKKNPLALLLVLLPIVVLVINTLAWAIAKIAPEDNFMPSGYRMSWYKG